MSCNPRWAVCYKEYGELYLSQNEYPGSDTYHENLNIFKIREKARRIKKYYQSKTGMNIKYIVIDILKYDMIKSGPSTILIKK